MKPAHKTTRQHMKFILPDKEILILVHDPAPLDQILLELGINPLEVIVTRNKKIIPEDMVVEADDEIRIIRIVHGG